MTKSHITAVALATAIASRAAAQQPQTQPADTALRVTAINAPAVPLSNEKASAKINRFSFVAYGDTRNSHDGTVPQEVHGLVVDAILAKSAELASGPDPLRFVVSSGDAVVNGQRVDMLNVSFVPLINRLTAAGLPYFFTAGNHDVTGAPAIGTPQRAVGLANLLAAHKNLIPPEGSPRRLTGYPTYAFGYGNTFVVGFDSNIAGDSTQYRWVKSQLESLDRKRFVNIVMVFHHPVFSSGPHGGANVESATIALRTMYMPLFRTHHVRLLITGHEHLFEHWIERYRDASGAHRIDEIVSGGGGAPLYDFSSEPDLTGYLANGAAAHVAVDHLVKPAADTTGNPHHYVVVHVDGEKLAVEVFGVSWGTGFSPYAGGVLRIPAPKK